jgi:hypothetical protein
VGDEVGAAVGSVVGAAVGYWDATAHKVQPPSPKAQSAASQPLAHLRGAARGVRRRRERRRGRRRLQARQMVPSFQASDALVEVSRVGLPVWARTSGTASERSSGRRWVPAHHQPGGSLQLIILSYQRDSPRTGVGSNVGRGVGSAVGLWRNTMTRHDPPRPLPKK